MFKEAEPLTGRSGSWSRHRHFETYRGKRAGLLKRSRHHFLFLPCVRTFQSMTMFPLIFCSAAESGRTPVLLHSVPCKYCHKSEWSVPAVCVGGQMGKGGNQPIITQQSFQNVLPKSFALFFFCTSLFRKFSVTWHSLPLPPPSSRPPTWIRLSLCACRGCGGCLLDWLPSCLMPGAQRSPAIRDAFSRVQTRLKNRHLILVFWRFFLSFFLFFLSLKNLDSCMEKSNSLLIQPLLHFDFLFRAPPFSEQLHIVGH